LITPKNLVGGFGILGLGDGLNHTGQGHENERDVPDRAVVAQALWRVVLIVSL
jgi:hypothetical protein